MKSKIKKILFNNRNNKIVNKIKISLNSKFKTLNKMYKDKMHQIKTNKIIIEMKMKIIIIKTHN